MAQAQEIKLGNGELARALLSAVVAAAVNALSHIDLDPYRQSVKDLAVKGFDDYIVPLDIPGVPAIFETTVEAAVRSQIPVFVDKAFDAIKNRTAGDVAAGATKNAFDFLTAPAKA